MPRKYDFPEEHIEYIKKNWLLKSDTQLAKKTGFKLSTVEGLRRRLGFFRSKSRPTDKEYIADICKMFANGAMILDIATKHKKHSSTVANILSRHWFKKYQSDNTKVIIRQSKINQNEPTGN